MKMQEHKETGTVCAAFDEVDQMLQTLSRVADIGMVYNGSGQVNSEDVKHLLAMMQAYIDDTRARLDEAMTGLVLASRRPA